MKSAEFKDSTIQLKKIYRSKKRDFVSRLQEFKNIWTHGDDKEIFTELAFCIFTPQSKAKSCWAVIDTLIEQDLLFRGSADEIKHKLHCVRFHNKKSRYLVQARKLFTHDGIISIKSVLSSFPDIRECREWLVKNITGLGYKEASHFLRNIGLGEEIAILDRHILKNLYTYNVIEKIPNSLSKSRYLSIEKRMQEFASEIRIPLSHLDLLLWYKETGSIFK